MERKEMNPTSAETAPQPLPLGMKTRWGIIGAVGMIGGERYYWLHKQWKTPVVAMIPASTLEPTVRRPDADNP
jgi:hypothetical protein